jgi:hypothetical protein
MTTTAVDGSARDRSFDGAFGGPAGSTRLQLVRAERPREQDEGRRFLIVANASRRIARATSLSEAFAALRAALVPGLGDRCTIHASLRRDETVARPGTRGLRVAALPQGHPLRECARRRESLLFSTTSAAMLRQLDACPVDGAPALGGCVHVLLAPIVLDRRLVVLSLLRGFARGPFDADDLLVAELALSRLPAALRREGARFRG